MPYFDASPKTLMHVDGHDIEVDALMAEWISMPASDHLARIVMENERERVERALFARARRNPRLNS
jgi:hypothetical protein